MNDIGRKVRKGASSATEQTLRHYAERAERRRAKALLARMLLREQERNPWLGVREAEDGSFSRYDQHAGAFVEFDDVDVMMDMLETPTALEDAADRFVHPRVPPGYIKHAPTDRPNTLRRWLRSMAGRPWTEVYACIVERFGHGWTPFLLHANVRQFRASVEAGGGDFVVDDEKCFQVRKPTSWRMDEETRLRLEEEGRQEAEKKARLEAELTRWLDGRTFHAAIVVEHRDRQERILWHWCSSEHADPIPFSDDDLATLHRFQKELGFNPGDYGEEWRWKRHTVGRRCKRAERKARRKAA